MTSVPTQAGFMQLQDSAWLLRAVFPNYPELGPCNPVPQLEIAAPPPATPVLPCDEGRVHSSLVM
jgi:hypothetical protein